MTNPQPHPSNPPTPDRSATFATLRRPGSSIAYPGTFEEADREIKRLLKVKRTSRADRRREIRAISADLARGGDAASIRSHELSGYGSSACWNKS